MLTGVQNLTFFPYFIMVHILIKKIAPLILYGLSINNNSNVFIKRYCHLFLGH